MRTTRSGASADAVPNVATRVALPGCMQGRQTAEERDGNGGERAREGCRKQKDEDKVVDQQKQWWINRSSGGSTEGAVDQQKQWWINRSSMHVLCIHAVEAFEAWARHPAFHPSTSRRSESFKRMAIAVAM
eukprot:351520-Chlamydomonas_euryale.AAC.4